MSAEVLKEYLVSLGWDIKSEQLKKFGAAIGGTEAILKRFTLSLGAAGLAVERNVMKTAEQLDRLYFAAQRVGTSAFQLQQFSYAAKQIGIAGEEMQGAISAVGMAMRMPGQAGLLRSFGVQSRDAATALDQLVGRLRRMPYFLGQNLAQQFGIGPQAFYQYSTQYDKFHKELLDRQRRARLAGNSPQDADAANSLMTKWRQIEDELGQIETKVFRALVDPLKWAFGWGEKLLEAFSAMDDKAAAIAVTIAATFGAGGALAVGAKVLRGVLGTGGAAGLAAGGASLSSAAQALMGSAAALNEAAIALGAKGAIPTVAGAPGKGTVGGGSAWSRLLGTFLPMLGIGQMLGDEFYGNPGRYPSLQRGFMPNSVRRRLQGGSGRNDNVGLQDWIFGSVMRGGAAVGQDASESLRDWLRGTSSFVPQVKVIQLPDSGSGGTSGGVWNTIKGAVSGAAGAVGRFFTPSSARAALPPDVAAHMARIGLGPEAATQWYTGSASAHDAEHGGFNFAGIRHPQGGFRTYPNEYAGVADAARLLRKYQSEGKDTLSKIISTWAPPNENNTEMLISRAEQWMGTGRNQQLNLNDPETLAKLLDTMNRNEFGGNRTVSPENLRKYARNYLANSAGGAAGAYGVPGAVMNLGHTGAVGAPGSNLVSIKTPSGQSFTVNRAAAPAFKAFVDELEGRGYKIGSIGGYSNRNIRGGSQLSEHAYGLAIDINPEKNPLGSNRTDMPKDIHALAAKYGLIWGGDWKKRPDPMHFQWGGSTPWADKNAPWNDDKAGALVPGGGLGKQSNITIEMNNDFQVSGFDHAEVGREVVRGLGRQNADLVRNLRSAVG